MGITCDNASPNNTMIEVLPELIAGFPGAANHTRCFNHIVALVAIRIVRQFDVSSGEDNEAMDEAERELQELAEGLDIEEAVTQREREVDNDGDEGDDDDGWREERERLSVADRKELDESVRPIRMLLVKVSVRSMDMFMNSPFLCSFVRFHSRSSTPVRSYSHCGLQHWRS